jgi:FtsP/CotA-like multicopper oxidase with cupredoxin domain
MPEIWIQLENRPWDTMPNNIDRMTGKAASVITGKPSEIVTITSPDTAGAGIRVSKNRRMYAPLRNSGDGSIMDALIFRRYKAPVLPDKSDAWSAPDDRKVNPWDINEKDPTDNGTMGTIPGPPIECNVGETVTVHFRNLDMRLTKPLKTRTHSMHVHGFVFKQEHDGAYPLSKADSTQRVDGTTPIVGQIAAPNETALWNSIAPAGSSNFGTFKIGDRVPPGGTFTYVWNTFGWATTAGVWLYHDHSFCDMDNMGLGAIGIVVIHNPGDVVNDFVVTNADFPDNSPVGNPIAVNCFPFVIEAVVDRSVLDRVGIVDPLIQELIKPGSMAAMSMPEMNMPTHAKGKRKARAVKQVAAASIKDATKIFAPDLSRVVQEGNMLLHLNEDLTAFRAFCTSTFKAPPTKAIYLQLFHRLTSSPGMNINGRTFLGNTPSVVAGTATKMRFGVVGMGGSGDVHTFHIHGHRWIMPGPHGTTEAAIKTSVQDTPVSQFEDTRIFGPANSFGFTINGAAGSFMRAGGPSSNDAKGEWHMHCHFLDHMMGGMMGSLLIVDANQAVSLQRGEDCPAGDVTPAATIVVKNFEFAPKDIVVPTGTVVTFDFVDTFHTATTVNKTGAINGIEINGGAANPNVAGDSGVPTPLGKRTVNMAGNMGDKINYQCGIHFAPMVGSITIGM